MKQTILALANAGILSAAELQAVRARANGG